MKTGMKKGIIYFTIIIFLSILITSCINGGTHGSIKGYRYPTSKAELENAVLEVINTNSNIHRKDTAIKNFYIDVTNGKYDTVFSTNYNDGKRYLTIKINVVDTVENEYIFQYYGSEKDWETSSSSEIFICYANDKNGNGGSEGHDSFKKNKKLKKDLIDVFEKEFISKIDKELKITPKITE